MVTSRFWTVALLLPRPSACLVQANPNCPYGRYLGLPTQGATTITSALVYKSSGPFDVGLLVINDISAQDSLPALSDKAAPF
jgi:hypothetical protein